MLEMIVVIGLFVCTTLGAGFDLALFSPRTLEERECCLT